MFDRAPRIIVGLIGVTSLAIGLWAAADPLGFYRNFPGGGRHWVALDGPYNEHLVRDFGSLNLAMAAVAAVAFWRPIRELLIAVGLANVVYGVPHIVYHLRHLDVYGTSDKIANIAALGAGLVLPVLLLVIALRPPVDAPAAADRSAASPV